MQQAVGGKGTHVVEGGSQLPAPGVAGDQTAAQDRGRRGDGERASVFGLDTFIPIQGQVMGGRNSLNEWMSERLSHSSIRGMIHGEHCLTRCALGNEFTIAHRVNHQQIEQRVCVLQDDPDARARTGNGEERKGGEEEEEPEHRVSGC